MGDPIIVRSILPDIVRLRNLGPIGDEIAKKLDALDPTKQQVPPAIQAQVQKLTALVQRLVQERQAKTVEIAGEAQIASMQHRSIWDSSGQRVRGVPGGVCLRGMIRSYVPAELSSALPVLLRRAAWSFAGDFRSYVPAELAATRLIAY